jgi:hypothetical protein
MGIQIEPLLNAQTNHIFLTSALRPLPFFIGNTKNTEGVMNIEY